MSANFTHSSPQSVGPLGGIVLLLHGAALPYYDAITGGLNISLGEAPCPVLPHRSDPRGTFLACGPVPPLPRRLLGTGDVRMPVMLRSRDEAPVEACPACSLRYTPALRVQATAGLSHLRGAAGDVITLVAHGLWPLLGESHGHHEQVSATIGGHDAIPRHPGSTAVSRRPDGGWRLDLSVPPTTAGTHELRVSVDRMGHDIDEVRPPARRPPTCCAAPRPPCWSLARPGPRRSRVCAAG